MNPVERRHARLLASIARQSHAQLRDLAEEFRVSMPTIRRDVAALAAQGHVVRSYGTVSIVARVRDGSMTAGIGIIAMNTSGNGYQGAVVDAVRLEAERRGLRCVLEVGEGKTSQRPLRTMIDQGLAGVVYVPRWRDADDECVEVPWLLESPIPVVLAERSLEWSHSLFPLDSVAADHRAGLALALRHLVDLGHRRVLSVVRDDSPTARRLHWYDRELKRDLGLADLGDPLLVPRDSPDLSPMGSEVVAAIHRVGATALFVHNDTAAVALTQDLMSRGIRVPEDCSVVSYDDYEGPTGAVPLTSVAPPKQDVGREAVALIARRRQRASDRLTTTPVAHLQLLPRLTVRASTIPPRCNPRP